MNLPLPPAPSWPASAPPPLGPGQPAPRSGWGRLLVNAVVAIVVIAVAGATFVFSYSGVHAIALFGGVSTQLARYYPVVFDALLAIACVTAVVLRDGRWWARLWAWLVVIVVLAAIGWVDAIHAMDYGLKHRPAEGAVAAAPVVAVLLAFSLLLTMLRQSRPRLAGPARPRGRRSRRDQADGPATESMPTILLPAVSAPAAPAPLFALPPGEVPPTRADPVLPPMAAVETAPEASQRRWDLPAPAQDEPVIRQDERDEAADDGDAADEGGADETAAPDVLGAPSAPAGLADADLDSPSARTRPIRYAGGSHRDEPASDDYWDGEDDPELAGQVYPARDADLDEPGAQAAPVPEDDEDAATYVTVPRLKRARVTPTPPGDVKD